MKELHQEAAARLAGEGPLRLGPWLHARGLRVHYEDPASRRVCCLDESDEPPAGWRPSPAQGHFCRLFEVSDGG
jgi:hypothetical protein